MSLCMEGKVQKWSEQTYKRTSKPVHVDEVSRSSRVVAHPHQDVVVVSSKRRSGLCCSQFFFQNPSPRIRQKFKRGSVGAIIWSNILTICWCMLYKNIFTSWGGYQRSLEEVKIGSKYLFLKCCGAMGERKHIGAIKILRHNIRTFKVGMVERRRYEDNFDLHSRTWWRFCSYWRCCCEWEWWKMCRRETGEPSSNTFLIERL